MSHRSLIEIYSEIEPDFRDLYVVPLIRYNYPQTDYLYLLYQAILESNEEISIHNTSAIGHLNFVLKQVSTRKVILHYHWFEFQDLKSLIGFPYKAICLWLFLLAGGKLVWTVHNKTPHDQKWLRFHKSIHSWLAKKAHKILVHGQSAITEIANFLDVDVSKCEVHPHPKFPSTEISKAKAVQELNKRLNLTIDENKFIIGHFGAISTYKGIPEIVEILQEQEFKGQFLVIGYVKKSQNELHSQLIQLSTDLEWFVYIPTFIDEDLLPFVMNSFDLCVFNHKQVLTSGAVELAHSYQRKIIAPSTGILAELDGDENVQLFQNRNELITYLNKINQSISVD